MIIKIKIWKIKLQKKVERELKLFSESYENQKYFNFS